MKRDAFGPIVVVLALIASIAGAVVSYTFHGAASSPLKSSDRPAFSLPDLDGVVRPVSTWDGRILVLNFWATWCPPCRDELPQLVTLQKEFGQRGVQVVGVAVDDPGDVRKFVAELGIPYPILVGSDDALRVSAQYGNEIGALPYTVVVSRGGKIVHTRHGSVKPGELEQAVKPLL